MKSFNEAKQVVDHMIAGGCEGQTREDFIKGAQLTADDMAALESYFGPRPPQGLYEVWHLADEGDHFELADWGLQERIGVQCSGKVLGIRIFNEMLGNRCDWCFVFVKYEMAEIGIEAIRKAVQS